MTKQQRVEHHAALESKLEHLKYSNGEFRAQLRQSREILSSSTRALGSRRLATEKASGDIRGFEKKLNRGLQSARVNAACRRKIDSLFILVENKLTQLGRLKIEAKAKLEKLEASLKEGKHKEETLRAAVQQEVSKAHQGANDLAAIRAQNIEAEKELLMAQNMEESTRTRVKALVCQIDSEKLQIEEQTTNLSTQITIEANKVASFEAQSEGLKNCLADRLQALNEEELNQNTSSEQKIAEGHFEIETVEASLQASRTKARDVQDSNSILQDEIEKMQAALDNNAEIVACNRRACQETTNSAEEMMASETERRKELSSFQLELDLEREAVDKLEKSSQEMKETRSMTSARHSHAIIACDEALEQARQGIDEARRAKESADTEHASGAVKWETERVDIFAELERAKTKSKAAEGTLSELDMLSKKVEEGFKAKLHQELMMIEERKAEEKEEIKAKVALILHSKFHRD